VKGDDGAKVVLTPIATPLPLTFVGLMVASLILSGLDFGWVPASETHIAGWVLLGVPLPLQLLAAVFGFHGRSATAATGSSTLAAAWLGTSLALINARPGSFTPSHAVGMLAIGVAFALLIPAAADLRAGAPLAAAVLIVASLRFGLEAITGLTESSGMRTATGVIGCVVAVSAFYGALALELEDNSIEDTLLPTFRAKESAQALRAPLDAQVEKLENEAGVRKNL
jgi:succinate-acetate transporter protein